MTLLNRLIVCLAVVSQLLLGTGRGVVLCIESDGSVRFEVSSIACCEPESAQARDGEQAGQECFSDEKDCGGCTDQSFQIQESPRGKHALPPLVAVPFGFSAEAVLCARIPDLCTLGRPPHDRRVACVESTVLRC